jgi:hypothetical protein
MNFWGGASWRHSQSLRPNEALQWQAMKIGKRKGVQIYDMGGGGEYKRKYGGKEIEVPWFWKSKYGWIRIMRDMAQQTHKLNQELRGWFNPVARLRQTSRTGAMILARGVVTQDVRTGGGKRDAN